MTLHFNLSGLPAWEYMTAAERDAAIPPAYREFMATKPSTPEHERFMDYARKLYPNLPPGAQQAAAYCREVDGPKAAAKYAANAGARWRIKGFKFVMPKRSNAGICTMTPKDRRERAEALERYRAHMAEGAKVLEKQRKASQRKFDREMKKVDPSWIPGQSLLGFPKFNAALAAAKEA